MKTQNQIPVYTVVSLTNLRALLAQAERLTAGEANPTACVALCFTVNKDPKLAARGALQADLYREGTVQSCMGGPIERLAIR